MSATARQIPHLFAAWDHVSRRIHLRKRVVLFLDFDGTLVRVAPTPQQVVVEAGTRAALKNLARRPNVTLAVISGRRRAELQRYIGLAGVQYLGLYGWEANGHSSLPLPEREALVSTILDLEARLAKRSKVWIEPKGASFSVHLMGTTNETRRHVEELVTKLLRPHAGTLKVIANLRDLEIAPVSIGDKGAAVRRILSEPGHRRALPIYFGDDLSDEPGFAAVTAGIPVLVGKRRATRAKFCLRGPAEVTETLSRLEEMIEWTEQTRPSSSVPSPL